MKFLQNLWSKTQKFWTKLTQNWLVDWVKRGWNFVVYWSKQSIKGLLSILTNPLEVLALSVVGVVCFAVGVVLALQFMDETRVATTPTVTTGSEIVSASVALAWKNRALAAESTADGLRTALEAARTLPAGNDSVPVKCAPEVKYVRSKCPKPSFWKSLDPVNW